MSAVTITPEQIRAIHAIKTRTRLDEASYRAMLQAYDVSTSKDLSRADADRLLIRMREIPGASRPVERPSKAKASGRFAPKLQAMWIAGWNLGVVHDRTDGAMHAFVERQTGVPHSRFLRDAMDARAAIEALKGWLAREAGVVWPLVDADRDVALSQVKWAILRAQWRRCIALGAVRAFGPVESYSGLVDYVSAVTRGASGRIGVEADVTPAELDKASSALGAKLRNAQAGTAEVRRAG
ncbi:regulatory protein GemA [Methylobacterium iners]|uniref:Mu-like prophage protein gp16 n=1 Tax=Methylobacterium iners TaxID=418707 RepID=A0ABQ4S6J5_9HYPH|nr:regulatory protein GemA [Methylobacterium iners]GJD97742.1 hypothetical protein OCOJLMKI_4975 [Methylobacterium iners]